MLPHGKAGDVRLVDADTLREVLADCAAEGQLTEREVRGLVDQTPAITCATCAYGYVGHDIVYCEAHSGVWELMDGCSHHIVREDAS